MKLRDHLDQFYATYNLPAEGGMNDKTFGVPLPFVSLSLPNFSWRRRMLFIHDLEHILNEKDTSWQDEIFIASWEISTGFFKNFPVIIFPLWTMGWGLWTHPKSLMAGFRKGHTDRGIARLPMTKEELLDAELSELQQLTLGKRNNRLRFFFPFKLLFWLIISQLIFLSPFLLLTAIVSIFFKLLY